MRRARSKQPSPSNYNPNVSYGDQSGAMDIDGPGVIRKNSVNIDASAAFRDKEWFLSTMPRKKVDTTMQLQAAPGDWVIRESESQAGALVMTFKALNGQVHSRRIKFANGLYTFDGERKAYSSIPLLVKSDTQIRRPAGDLFGRTLPRKSTGGAGKEQRRKSSSRVNSSAPAEAKPAPYIRKNQVVRERSESFSGFGDPRGPRPSAAGDGGDDGFGFDEEPAVVQTNQSEDTGADDFGGFGDSPPPVRRRSSHRQSPASTPTKSPQSSPATSPQSSNSGALSGRSSRRVSSHSSPKKPLIAADEIQVECESTDLAVSLGLTGVCVIAVHKSRRAFTICNQFDVSAKESWTVTALRRYGREDGKFYFEAGRRCASGEGMIYLVSENFDTIFERVDAHVRSAREQMKASKAAQQKNIAEANAKRLAEQKEEEERQKKEMERLAKEAEAEARRQVEEEKRKEDEARRAREEQERKAEEEKKKAEEARARRPKKSEGIYGTVADLLKDAEKLEVSEKTEAAVQVKQTSKADKYAGMFTEAPKDQPKHSKIWLALNPQPLAYQTRDDQRQKEEKMFMGAVGSKDFNMRRDVLETTEAVVTDAIVEEVDPFGIAQEVTIDDDAIAPDEAPDDEQEEEIAEEEDEDYDPDREVPEEELENEDVTSFMAVLAENRKKREAEEAENKRKLAEAYRKQKEERQRELDKELALIAAKKKIEDEERERKKDEALKEAMANAAELVFDFTFG